MEVANDVWQDLLSSVISDSKEGDHSGDALSPEDAAWVDSCFVKDPELTDRSWDALRDALLDIAIPQPTPHYKASASGSEEFRDVLMSDEDGATESLINIDEFLSPTSGKEEMSTQGLEGVDDDLGSFTEKTEYVRFESLFRNNVLSEFPNLEGSKDDDDEADLVSMNDVESPHENIFKVWNFDAPTEEDDFDKELTKAFTESSLEAPPGSHNSSGDLDKEAVDNLVAGIADLSLRPSSY